MKNFKKISIVVVALSCLVETSNASLSPNYADDANALIQSTSRDDKIAQFQAIMKSRRPVGGQNSLASGSIDELKAVFKSQAELKARLKSQDELKAKEELKAKLKAKDELKAKEELKAKLKAKDELKAKEELKAKLKAKDELMSGGKGQSSIMEMLKSKGVSIQSIEPQELANPVVEILPPAFVAPAEQAIDPLEAASALGIAEEPSVELESTLVPTNSALEPALIPGATEEAIAFPVQNVSEGELMLEPSEDLTASEEELYPTLVPTMETLEELTVPAVTVEDESTISMQPEATSVNQFLAEDEDSDSEDQEDELDADESDLDVDTQPAVTSVNQFLTEDEGDSEDLSIPTSDTTSLMESADINIEEAPSIPTVTLEPIEVPTKEVGAGIKNEIMSDDIQDQPEEIIVPVVPSEPVEVPAVTMSDEDDLTDTINDNQVIVVKVYPVLDAMYSAAQSVKAAALDMINYVFNKAKAARKKAKKDLTVIETDLKSVE